MSFKNKFIHELLDTHKITQDEYNILFEKTEYKEDFLVILNKVILIFKEEEHLHLDGISFPNLPQLSDFYSYIINILGTRCSNNLREIGFWNCNFYSEINIKEVPIKHHLCFGKAIFHKKVNFNKSTFEKRIDFLQTTFKDDITFSGTKFQDEAHFWDSDAHKFIGFQSVTCSKIFSIHRLAFKTMDMDNAQFKEVNFVGLVGLNNNKYVTLNKTHFSNKETTILLRSYLEKHNHITEANKYFQIGQDLYIDYLRERITEPNIDNLKERITEPNGISTLSVLYLNKLVSNFGTDWIRPLLVMFIFGFFASFFYYVMPLSEKESIELFNNTKNVLWWSSGGFLFATLFYIIYLSKEWGILIILSLSYIVLLISVPDTRSLTNDISKLINPLNIFKSKDYFEHIAPYGMIVKLVMATLIYQFIIAFRQNTRRK